MASALPAPAWQVHSGARLAGHLTPRPAHRHHHPRNAHRGQRLPCRDLYPHDRHVVAQPRSRDACTVVAHHPTVSAQVHQRPQHVRAELRQQHRRLYQRCGPEHEPHTHLDPALRSHACMRLPCVLMFYTAEWRGPLGILLREWFATSEYFC